MIIETTAKIAEETPPLLLDTKQVYCKKPPYQKITLEVERSAELHAIHTKIDNLFGGEYSKKEYPHISFFYSLKPCDELQREVSKIGRIVPQKVLGQKIALVHCKGTPEVWRMLYEWKLNE